MSFGKILKQLRESNGYSMDKLVELYNIKFNGKMNKSTLSRYENELQEPMFTVIVNLAKLFNVTVDYLSGNDCMDDELKNRLNQALNIKNMKPLELSLKTKIPKSSISQYMSGYAKPKADRIYAISKALNVSEAWLMGYDVPMERDSAAPTPAPLKMQESEITQLCQKLSDTDKNKVIGFINGLLSSETYTKKPQKIFRAARSTDGTPPEIIDRDDALMDKLKKAPKVTSDEDL